MRALHEFNFLFARHWPSIRYGVRIARSLNHTQYPLAIATNCCSCDYKLEVGELSLGDFKCLDYMMGALHVPNGPQRQQRWLRKFLYRGERLLCKRLQL